MHSEERVSGVTMPLELIRAAPEVRPSTSPSAIEAIRSREATTRWALVSADVVAMALALLVSVSVLGADEPRPLSFLFLPLTVLVAKLSGMYDRDELVLRRSTLDELPRIFPLVTLMTLLVWLGERLLVDGRLGHGQVATLWASLLLGMAVARAIGRRAARRVAPAERCLVVGDAATLARLRDRLGSRPGVQLVGSCDLESVLGDLPSLRWRAADHGAHRLIIAPPATGQHELVLDLVRGAKATGLRVSLLPGLLEVVGSSVEFDELDGMTLLGMRRFGLTPSSRLLKRGLDVLGAVFGLTCVAPVMLVIAVLVRRDSRGPALFRQTRVGRDGRTFEILKFRTMVDGADALREGLADRNEATGLFKIAGDPRITRVGRRLRQTSLDELPQLLNVLRGEMSLVGPRPLVVDEDEQVTGFDRRRLVLTPGMTGPWQVAGSARVPLHEMVKMDYLYAANWSLWSDVKILLRTVPYMLAHRGQ